MKHTKTLNFVLLVLLALAVHIALQPAYAQQPETTELESTELESAEALSTDIDPFADKPKTTISADARADAIAQLAEIQQALAEKNDERNRIQGALPGAGPTNRARLNEQLDKVNQDIDSLERTFKQIASDGAEVLADGGEEQEFDWRGELITIVKPLFENVKGLTEKPRKIEALRRGIRENNELAKAIEDAKQSTTLLIQDSPPDKVRQELEELLDGWDSTLRDIARENNLAQFQLNKLEGRDVSWTQTVKDGLRQFAYGRGFTLVLALATALIIWLLMWSVVWIIRKRTQGTPKRDVKTGYRLAAWGYKALAGLLISIGVMSVFYLRQDLFLLAIVLVTFFGAALALRSLLPRYINEGRLLLNLGSVREREQLMYRGVPWKVDVINVQTYLSNPELKGVVRLPLNSLHDMVSRPITKTNWFPSSQGDWVLGSDPSPLEVIEQNVELVELRSRNGIIEYMPTADFFAAGYRNLSRNGQFRVRVTFGVDYNLQDIALTEVSDAFAKSITEHIQGESYAEDLIEARVEFDSAGESSLDYWIAVSMKSTAAQYYRPIRRQIQKACVAVCNERGWGIPFPQVMMHTPPE